MKNDRFIFLFFIYYLLFIIYYLMRFNNNTIQQKINLISRARDDLRFYIENFLHIETTREKVSENCSNLKPIRGSIYRFIFNDEQKLIYKEILKQRKARKPIRLIILKARQLGISTFCCGVAFAWTVLYPNIKTIIIAHREYASLRLLTIIKLFYETLPEFIKPNLLATPRRQMLFDNSSGNGLKSHIAVAVSADRSSGRSTTNNIFIASELSEWEFPEETMLSVLQTVPSIPNSMIILEGTAKGYGTYFHNQWLLAKEGRTDFKPVFIPWFLCKSYQKPLDTYWYDIPLDSVEYYQPEKEYKEKFNLTDEQLYWRRWAIDNKCNQDSLSFCQEYPATDEEAFISVNLNVFNVRKLQKLMFLTKQGEQGYIKNNLFTSDYGGQWTLWEKPVPQVKYIIGVDTGTGIPGGDLSVIEVIRADTLDQVAEFASDELDTTIFSSIVLEAAKYFNNAFLVIEVVGCGISVLDKIKEHYFNLYVWERYDEFGKVTTKKLGFVTSGWSKHLLLDDIKDYINQDLGHIYSKKLILELMNYQKLSDHRTGNLSGTDDRIMAFGLCLRGYRSEQRDWRTSTLSEVKRGNDISAYTFENGFIKVPYYYGTRDSNTSNIYSPYGVIG